MTLTLKDIPLELDAALRQRAQEQHKPVDQIAVEAMKAGLGLQKSGPGVFVETGLASSIRNRFAPIGGIQLADPVRDPLPEPLDFGE